VLGVWRPHWRRTSSTSASCRARGGSPPMRTPHTQYIKGKRVWVILRDGTIIVDKFVEKRRNGTIVLEEHTLHVDNIRSMSDAKPGINPRNMKQVPNPGSPEALKRGC